MNKRLNRETYYAQLEKVDEKYSLDLDWRHYESLAERDVRFDDLFSVANGVSIAGLALVVDGCRDISSIQGVNKIAVGRGFDVFDGSIASWLNQSSDTGAIVDVTCDKLGLGAIYLAARREKAIPAPYLHYLLGKHLAHTGLTVANGYMHPTESFRPPISGKISMLADNLAGGAYLYANAYRNEQPERGAHDALQVAGTMLALGSIGIETKALYDLTKRLGNK